MKIYTLEETNYGEGGMWDIPVKNTVGWFATKELAYQMKVDMERKNVKK